MGRRIALLLFILAFGASVEMAWQWREVGGLGALRAFGVSVRGQAYTFETEETHAVPEGAALEVENALGSVEVGAGGPGEVRVKLRKVVFAPTEDHARRLADLLRLESRAGGAGFHVGTNRRTLERSGESRGLDFETHLVVAAPPGTAVTVRSEHGAVRVADAASADLKASFDEVRAERVAGPVVIGSRHGDVHVRQVEGPVSVTARHGDVEVRGAVREVLLDLEHGHLSTEGTGPLTVQLAHGNLAARHVEGDLRVTGRHAQVDAEDVSGRVEVESSYEDVRLSRIAGEVTVKTRNGEVAVADASAGATVETSYDDVAVARVEGPVSVTVPHGAFRGSDLKGSLAVRSSGDEVEVDGFAGPVDIQSSRASVRLRPRVPVREAILVRTTHGAVTMAVPPGSRFELEASAKNGEVAVDVPQLRVQRMEGESVQGQLGEGGAAVRLSTEYAEVRLERAEAMAGEGSLPPPQPVTTPAAPPVTAAAPSE